VDSSILIDKMTVKMVVGEVDLQHNTGFELWEWALCFSYFQSLSCLLMIVTAPPNSVSYDCHCPCFLDEARSIGRQTVIGFSGCM
jgi:hypothetical protein